MRVTSAQLYVKGPAPPPVREKAPARYRRQAGFSFHAAAKPAAEAIHFDIWRHQVDIFHKRIGIQFITHNGYPVRLRLSGLHFVTTCP